MRKIFVFMILFLHFLSANKSDFEKLGDVMTLAPIGVFIITIGMKDYEGSWQLSASTLATQGTIEIIKRGFEYAHNHGADVPFAKRPLNDDYKGMPSGHSGGGFSAASFVYYRYGIKPALPLIAMAVATAASRVYARKHTLLQVAVGGIIAWGWSYIFTTKYKGNQNLVLIPDIGYDNLGGSFYGVRGGYRW